MNKLFLSISFLIFGFNIIASDKQNVSNEDEEDIDVVFAPRVYETDDIRVRRQTLIVKEGQTLNQAQEEQKEEAILNSIRLLFKEKKEKKEKIK